MTFDHRKARLNIAALAALKCGLGLSFAILYFVLSAKPDLATNCTDQPLQFITFAKWGFVGLLVASIFCTLLQVKSLQPNLTRPECYHGWGRLLEIFSAMLGICIWFFGCLAVFQYNKCTDVFANTVIRITCASPIAFILYFIYRAGCTWVSEQRKKKEGIPVAAQSWMSSKDVSGRDETVLPEMRRIQEELENNLRELEKIKIAFQNENKIISNSNHNHNAEAEVASGAENPK